MREIVRYALSKTAEKWAVIWRFRGLFQEILFRSQLVDNFLNKRQLFFMMCTGRSGTQLISTLLNQDDSFKVLHEPNIHEDRVVMEASRRDPEFAFNYLDRFRKYEIYRRLRKEPNKINYGEVSGMLRYHCNALRRLFPDARFLILVRDGREVVRSIMGRVKFYAPDSRGSKAISPLPGDPYLNEWESMSRFEKICWLWMDTYNELMNSIPVSDVVRLEGVISDYNYFNDKVLRKLNMKISKKTWESIVRNKSANTTKVHTFPHWSHWSSEERNSFERICKKTMLKLGYDL